MYLSGTSSAASSSINTNSNNNILLDALYSSPTTKATGYGSFTNILLIILINLN